MVGMDWGYLFALAITCLVVFSPFLLVGLRDVLRERKRHNWTDEELSQQRLSGH